jgi:molecular chaperone HtpG
MAPIGKYVIDSLTSSMYEESRCIYREYIQNAADQIDLARELFPDGDFSVSIQIKDDTIEIFDDATGINLENAYLEFITIGKSSKIRGKNKGFRGIGRLGGLAYCDTLTFETSYYGEDRKSIMVWDAKRLRELVDDESLDLEAGEVVDDVTKFDNSQPADRDSHYFKITMEGVTDKALLDVYGVRDYISIVAPVEIANTFAFKGKLSTFMQEHGLTLDTYKVFVNNDPVYKNYNTTIYDQKKGGKVEIDKINDIRFFYKKDENDLLMYWGWYSISNLIGVIPPVNINRGIRLRCKNIQMGDANRCRKFYIKSEDKRYTDYFFGEIHVEHPALIPDSHRDYFKTNSVREDFELQMYLEFQKLRSMCYNASAIRSDVKSINEESKYKRKLKEKRQNGFTSEKERQHMEDEFQSIIKKSEKAKKELNKILAGIEANPDSPMKHIASHYKNQLISDNPKEPTLVFESDGSKETTPSAVAQIEEKKNFLRTDGPKYKKLNKETKDALSKVYDVIFSYISDTKQRDFLINKIEEVVTNE